MSSQSHSTGVRTYECCVTQKKVKEEAVFLNKFSNFVHLVIMLWI